MVHGYHVVFGTYGFWLPNDPRGSWSDFVAAWELLRFGNATKTDTRRSVAGVRHDALLRKRAKEALKYPAVVLTGDQAAAVGRGFAESVHKSGFTLWACSILPEHVHLVVARHHFKIEQAVNLLKGEATKRLASENRHPLAEYRNPRGRAPTPWVENAWKVYLDSAADIARSIAYVERNPIKEGKPRQSWPFVTPFYGIDVLPRPSGPGGCDWEPNDTRSAARWAAAKRRLNG